MAPRGGMEPIPESAAVLAGLEATGSEDLADNVREVSRLVRSVVPQCTGMSLSLLAESLTLTLVASDAQVAALDGVQYLEGGPCVEAINKGDEPLRTDDLSGRLDEEAWRVFATAGAAAGVLSTLSFPIRDEQGRVLGGVNLYAATAHAFAGHEATLIRMLGGWAVDAMTNADLTFATRTSAREAPGRLADQDVVAQAVGMLSVLDGVSADRAHDRLLTAAAKAGVSAQELARTIIDGQIRDAGS
jgi:GAF domain-containing protein